MNKIYSKVWNKELGQLVVASELASSDSTGAVGSGRLWRSGCQKPVVLGIAAGTGWHVGQCACS